MAVSSVDVRSGDPSVQASGQYRGTVDVLFDDGRVITLNLRAPDLDAWNDAVANAGAQAQEMMESRDAQEAVGDTDIAANKEASIAQSAIAYIRAAWTAEAAYDAWILFSRINTFITNNGGWVTAKPILLANGLAEEEYDQCAAAYNYLSGAGRPATLAEARTIQGNWEAQH